MTRTLLMEDLIVYVCMLLAVSLYVQNVYRQLTDNSTSDSERVKRLIRKLRLFFIGVVTYLVVLGGLHQLGLFSGPGLYVLAAMGCAGALGALLYVRRLLRSA